ncbi:MAG: hypothetical protein J0M00_18560 [Burkholderiales bacterium]|nr:hypothetical protein [Burkholderiales bacterium]
MSRKRCHRRVIVPLPPRGLRPKLDKGQLFDLSMAHNQNVDAVAKGDANETTLWHLVESAYTWSRAAELLHFGELEMTQQLHMLEGVLARYHRTRRIGFSGPELELARDGVVVMDQIAAQCDRPTALAAVAWSEARIERILAEQRQGLPA